MLNDSKVEIRLYNNEKGFYYIEVDINTIIEKVYVYEVDGTTYDITNEFYDIQKDMRLSVFLLHFPRFNEGKNFVVQNKRQKSKERPNCNLYISKGERMKICA